MSAYLADGLPQPVPAPGGLDAPYWEGTRAGRLMIQRCNACRTWQWGPELLCHACKSFDVGYEEVEPRGVIYSYERVWHPVHPALADQGPYLVVLVELPQAGNVRVVGNLLGDPLQSVTIGSPVNAVFEPHDDAPTPFTLVQWRVAD